jgi:hypothetical protein
MGDFQKHVVVSASYTGDTIPSSDVSKVVSTLFDDRGVDGVVLLSYTQTYFTPPQALSLKDAWIGLTDEQRGRLPVALSDAIRAMLGQQ